MAIAQVLSVVTLHLITALLGGIRQPTSRPGLRFPASKVGKYSSLPVSRGGGSGGGGWGVGGWVGVGVWGVCVCGGVLQFFPLQSSHPCKVSKWDVS